MAETTQERYGAKGLRWFREATESLCDIKSFVADDAFHFEPFTMAFDGAVLIDSRVTKAQYDRTARHVALGGMDLYYVTLCTEGRVDFTSGRRNVEARPGDFYIVDKTQPNRASFAVDGESGLSGGLSLTLPRSLLAPLLAAPNDAAGSVLPRESSVAQSLAGHLFALRYSKHGNVPVGALAGLVADAIGASHAAEEAITHADRDLTLASIKRHIDANLRTDMVSVDFLCRRFRLSRASLYRLFESDGGLWRYIQDQRLARAFRRLTSVMPPRIIDVALESGFGSDTTFVRAFRRRFDLTPGEVKQLAESGAAQRVAEAASVDAALGLLRTLGQS